MEETFLITTEIWVTSKEILVKITLKTNSNFNSKILKTVPKITLKILTRILTTITKRILIVSYKFSVNKAMEVNLQTTGLKDTISKICDIKIFILS